MKKSCELYFRIGMFIRQDGYHFCGFSIFLFHKSLYNDHSLEFLSNILQLTLSVFQILIVCFVSLPSTYRKKSLSYFLHSKSVFLHQWRSMYLLRNVLVSLMTYQMKEYDSLRNHDLIHIMTHRYSRILIDHHLHHSYSSMQSLLLSTSKP